VKSLHVTAHQIRVHSLALEEFLRDFDDGVLPTLVQMLGVMHSLFDYVEEKGESHVLPFDELALEDVDEALECLYWLFRGSNTKDDTDGVDAPQICVSPETAMITLKRPPERRRRPAQPPTTGIARVRIELYRTGVSGN
jgi:hypothetical protein